MITEVINNAMLIVVVKNLNDGVHLINDFAPEHMINCKKSQKNNSNDSNCWSFICWFMDT